MTIKLPEPRKVTGTEVGYYYTEKDLKQAIRDALDEAAKAAEQAARNNLPQYETVSRITVGRWCVEAIRKLKEQLK